MPDYTIRNSERGDLDFILDPTRETFKEHVIKAHGKWDKTKQRKDWETNLDPEFHKIIELNRKRIGLYATTEDSVNITLDLVFLTPEYQGKGIGSQIVNNLIEEAEKKSKSLTLKVLRSNIDARTFYENKGFQVVKEDEKRFYLEYQKK